MRTTGMVLFSLFALSCGKSEQPQEAQRRRGVVGVSFTDTHGEEVKMNFVSGKMTIAGEEVSACDGGKEVVGPSKLDSWCEAADGGRHGLYRAIYPSGTDMVAGQYESGRRDGLWRYWDEAGEIMAFEHYKLGKLTLSEAVSKESNETVRETVPPPSFLDTWWLEGDAHCEGETIFEGSAPPAGDMVWCRKPNGTKHGTYTHWWKRDSMMIVEGSYEEDRSVGMRTMWSEAGQKLETVPLVAGKAHGTLTNWHPSTGRVRLTGQMVNGVNEGVWKDFDETGKLIRIREFSAGEVLMNTEL